MKDRRFTVIYQEGSEWNIKYQILLDRETGIQYLMAKSGYGAGLTPLLDRDGKPLVDWMNR